MLKEFAGALLRTALLFFAVAGGARADVALLIHGYLGAAHNWETSGVTQTLAAAGWMPAGVIGPGYNGPTLPPPSPPAPRKQYSLELPSTAPMMVQSDILMAALKALEARHANEDITLVGHSAGGVVARMALVRGGAGHVKRLISIAAPHLGTERALQALDLTRAGGPLNILKDTFGGDTYRAVKHSWPVLLDLAPAIPGSTLFWLNTQPHPDIEYISLVRGAPQGVGDFLVPGPSQDMNLVPALRGRAKTLLVDSDHALSIIDGRALADLMR